MITELKNNQIFVFGSNLAGKHIGGAAKQAKDKFGAIEGQGEGLQGQSYAFPTLTKTFMQRYDLAMQISATKLFNCCEENLNKEFILTPVGTGIAGYSIQYMKSLFENSPKNLILPKEFK